MPNPTTNISAQIFFHHWEDSNTSCEAAASLGSNEVRVWIATVPADERRLAGVSRVLSPEERQRAERFKANEPRREFVFGRAILRQLLGASLNVEPTVPVFGYGPQGKPFLLHPAGDAKLGFNLAHSGGLVVIALASGRDVGVDIESIHQLDNWPDMAERIFSPRELRELRALPESQQLEAFFNGWTRKEAYFKATGEGLTGVLPAVAVSLTPLKEPELLETPAGSEASRPWAICAIPTPPGIAGAVVFEM